jgi:hypothetical protein
MRQELSKNLIKFNLSSTFQFIGMCYFYNRMIIRLIVGRINQLCTVSEFLQDFSDNILNINVYVIYEIAR